jgi:hypothetical protein
VVAPFYFNQVIVHKLWSNRIIRQVYQPIYEIGIG